MSGMPRKNPSGLNDPTAHDALLPIIQADEAVQHRTNALIKALIKALKAIIELAGYDLLARIEVRDRASGQIFR